VIYTVVLSMFTRFVDLHMLGRLSEDEMVDEVAEKEGSNHSKVYGECGHKRSVSIQNQTQHNVYEAQCKTSPSKYPVNFIRENRCLFSFWIKKFVCSDTNERLENTDDKNDKTNNVMR